MNFYGLLFNSARVIGRPFGGIRPRRIYHWLARRAFKKPVYSWVKNRWNARMWLSPFYHLDRHIICFGTYDQDMHEYIEAHVKPGMCCMDIGANIGEVTLHLSKNVGASGRVDSFEPAPILVRRLRQNVAENQCANVKIYETAIADQVGVLAFTVAEEEVENQGMGSLVNHVNEVVSVQVQVQVTTLDHWMLENSITRCDLIKVDIQGAELSLVRGALQFLKRFQPQILMEISHLDLACANSTPRELVSTLEKIGYQAFEFSGEKLGRRIDSATVPDDFMAYNVLFKPIAKL